ncbi:MAG: TIGR03067 domain-containing protein, partial [Planctomycetaceae bacterium]|nr:TIGR03067 domain-containing protein [Planctomycetaceae bacterium]
MPTIACPKLGELLDFAGGKLPEDAADALATHLETCPACQAELATLPDADDTLAGRLRSPDNDELLVESECGRALARAKAVFGEPALGEAGPDASQTALPQQLGEYQLIERIGSGGMGAVYKAIHRRLDRVVAIKVLPRGRLDDARAVVRFEREMKAIGRLDDPHIVRANDAREIDGRLVLVMEFVEGLDLGKIVHRLGKLDVADACEVARQAAIGLQAAHEHGLVHRDVKPSNLMLTPEGAVKVLDLGLARFHGGLGPGKGDSPHLCEAPEGPFRQMGTVPFSSPDEDMTDTGLAMGTADYMAPEQATDSRAADVRADVYSLGATLYKLLAGRAPFAGPEHQAAFEKLLAHRQEPVPPIREFRPDVPQGLCDVLDRMLAKTPASRYSTPAEAAAALAPWCPGSDLPALLRRAVEAASSPLPPGEGQGEGNQSPRPLGEGQGEGHPQPLAASQRWKSRIRIAILLLLIGGLGFSLGILIRIKKDGRETTVEAPDGSTARVSPSGDVNVELPGQANQAGKSVVSPAADLKALKGQWKIVRIEKGKDAASPLAPFGVETVAEPGLIGATLPADDANRLDFDEDGSLRIRMLTRAEPAGLVPRGWSSLSYRIDPAATPKTIDLYTPALHADGSNRDEQLTAFGIYEIEGNRLKIRLTRYFSSLANNRRPKGFSEDSPAASGDCTYFLERYAHAEEENAIVGSWNVVSQVEDGKPVSAAEGRLRGCFIQPESFLGSSWATPDGKRGGPLSALISFSMDVSCSPKQITFFDTPVPYVIRKPQVYPGIYKLDADRLTIAYHKGNPRPERFESKPGSGVTLLVLRKGEPTPAPTQAAGWAKIAPPPAEPVLQFGPVVERVVNAASEGKGSDAIDLVGGRLVDLPKDFTKWPADKQGKWCADNNVDLSIDVVPSAGVGMVSPPTGQLVPEGLKLAAVVNERWDNATHENLRSALTSITPGMAVVVSGGAYMSVAELHERRGTTYYDILSAPPVTFAFQTRKGDLGILQVLRYTEEPRGMRIRYKLAQPPAVSPTADLRALKGQWKIVRIEKGKDAGSPWAPFGVETVPDPAQSGATLPVSDADRLDFTEEGGLRIRTLLRAARPWLLPMVWSDVSYRINPTATPKTIDLYTPAVHKEGFSSGDHLTALGIYEIEGNRLKIRLTRYFSSLANNRRPKGFSEDSPAASGDCTYFLERYAHAEEENAIVGEWIVASLVDDGKPVSAADGLTRCYVRPESFSLSWNTPDGQRGTPPMGWSFSMDVSCSPKQITFFGIPMPLNNGETPKSQDYPGIYKLEGDRLTIAYHKGGPRPERFESKPGSGVTLLVLRKAEQPKVGGMDLGVGGFVMDPSKKTKPAAKPAAPSKRRSDGSAGAIRSVYLGGYQVTDAQLEDLKGLAQLQSLNLANSQVTNAGMDRVKELTSLRELNLTFTKVTDAGLEKLKGLTKLESLSLHRTGITDTGIAHLKGLTHLKSLSLYGTRVTDAGLEQLEGFRELESLDLGATGVT